MQLHYSDGRTTDHDSIESARTEIDRQYPNAVYGNGWETRSPDSDRMLIWANRSDADGPDGNGDGGQNAVAEIIRER